MAKNFKPGQKVVFFNRAFENSEEFFFEASFPRFILPKENEIVTLYGNGTGPNFWILDEYPVTRLGNLQALSDTVLFPVEQISAEQTEKITAELEKSFTPLEISINQN